MCVKLLRDVLRCRHNYCGSGWRLRGRKSSKTLRRRIVRFEHRSIFEVSGQRLRYVTPVRRNSGLHLRLPPERSSNDAAALPSSTNAEPKHQNQTLTTKLLSVAQKSITRARPRTSILLPQGQLVAATLPPAPLHQLQRQKGLPAALPAL